MSTTRCLIAIADHRIECESIAAESPTPNAPTIVFLHEGLGSIAMWRDFPSRICDATGCNALIYSRRGHGASDPLAAAHRISFMHDEALIVLPALLDALGITRPILLGHSSGASIALIHAGGSNRPVAGVVALAPHVFVEEVTVAAIAAARGAYRGSEMPARLGRYHRDADHVFDSWTNVWLDPAFRAWNIESYVQRVRCPVLTIQGFEDEYGTMEQIDRVALLAPDVELLKLSDCGHSAHRDQPEAVAAAVTRFVHRVCA